MDSISVAIRKVFDRRAINVLSNRVDILRRGSTRSEKGKERNQ